MKNKNYIIFTLIIIFFLSHSKLFAGEFLNTFLHINLCGSYGFVEGDVFNHEHDSYYIKDYQDDNIRPSHYAYSFGAFVDVLPLPALILGDEAHAVKLGVRAAYRFYSVVQNIDYQATRTDEDTLRENYIVYKSFMTGLVIRYAPMIKPSSMHGDYLSNGGFTVFALYGKLRDGNLYSYPIMRERNDTQTTTVEISEDKKTKIIGYRLDLGIGGELSICSINLGLNAIYSMTTFTMDNQLYNSISKKTSYTEWSFEFYLSLPLEWSKTKKHF